MPAYHHKLPDNKGFTLVNIGVGPANAKTISDHVAVLRPDAMIMVGHCGGLRNHQNIGDFVLATGFMRHDGVLDDLLPLRSEERRVGKGVRSMICMYINRRQI